MNRMELSVQVVQAMCLVLVAVLAQLWVLRNRTVRVYNWNGHRFCYLGSVVAGKKAQILGILTSKDTVFVIKLNRRTVESAHTTLFRFCPGKNMLAKHKYEQMLVETSKEKRMIPIEEGMQQFIYCP